MGLGTRKRPQALFLFLHDVLFAATHIKASWIVIEVVLKSLFAIEAGQYVSHFASLAL